MKAGTMTESSTSPTPAPALKCIAWCPDDCDQSAAREYVGSNTPREIAEQHAEYVYYEQGTRRECYEVRVRATRGDWVREWDVTVDVEIEVSFSAASAFPRKSVHDALDSETLPAPPGNTISPDQFAEIIDE